MLKRDFWKDHKLKKITASVFLLAVFLLLSLIGSGQEITYENAEDVTGSSKEVVKQGLNQEENDERSETIFVDISGCVAHPGVYQLPSGSRLFEVLDLAGGLTEEADLRSINRASVLVDEQVIVVLSVEEYEKQQAAFGDGVGYIDGKVDLNLADSTALESLSGVGPSTAERIIDYRTTNGPFRRIEDLMNVDGIGEKTFQKLKNHICVR